MNTMEFGADQPAESKRIQLSGTVTITGRAKATLIQFPTHWETSLANFVSQPEFDAIVTELGRLAAADSNQEQEIFDALAYLINKDDFGSSVDFVANQLQNSFDKKLGRDSVEPVKAEALKMIVEGTEASTDKLRKLFGKFGDYHNWIIKRMPPI